MQSSVIGQVIRQVSAGDRSAFRILFNAYYSRVYRFAERILKDSLYADEVAQAVFVGLWRKREMLDPDRNFENYLYVLSRHAVTDFMRLNRRARLAEGLEAVTDTGLSGDSTDAVAEYHLIQSQIDKIVEGMPEQRRKVYCMSRNDGLSNDEIAERLQISKRTVERHLNLALNTLRKEMSSFCFILAVISAIS